MKRLYARLGQFESENDSLMGRKAANLDLLIQKGFKVPSGICLSSELYNMFLEQSGLGTWLSLNVERKPLNEMRWEEIWDLSLKISHKFLKTPFPDSMQTMLLEILEPFLETAVVVRSSSLNEDSGDFSFAGLHDSIVGVRGMYSILEAIKEVWSSLWSDRALVYSNRFGLSLQDSSMAVIIQELVSGECSGVLFTQSFNNRRHAMIETVAGLNEGLVSGREEPDRISIDSDSKKIIEWTRAHPLTDQFISEESIRTILNAGLSLERDFKYPLDIEWTIAEEKLVLLQVRPITTETNDNQKSFEELESLKNRMLDVFLPQLNTLAFELSEMDLGKLDNASLELELNKRKELVEKWEQTYVDQFIPLAHGVRLFGEVYNKVVKPESPFEFIELLIHDNLVSLNRNRDLEKLAFKLNRESHIPETELDSFLNKYGQTSFFDELLFADRDQLLKLLKNFSQVSTLEDGTQRDKSTESLEASFLRAMIAVGRDDGPRLLDLARMSYKLRDDDNIAVSKISGEYFRVVEEYNRRIGKKPIKKSEVNDLISEFKLKKRQVTGVCASPGLAKGAARVIRNAEDLFETQKGEILICDSIDPSITFIIPLVSAIVERRGGMLVHGAIIAREYGIPCITGVKNAIEIIETGDKMTVDAYSGIITLYT